MSASIMQRFIDQHPSLFAAIFPVYFVALWLLVGAIVSLVGGWFSLSNSIERKVRSMEQNGGDKAAGCDG